MENININKSKIFEKISNDWDQKSSVRNNPETYDLNLPSDVTLENTPEWHLPTYSGILKHQLFANLDYASKKFVMGTQLLEFVMKQARFEIDCVNDVAQKIGLDKYKFHIPENLRLDALKIYTDEGYHAYFTKKIANQIKNFYKIEEEDLTPYIDIFFEKIKKIGSKFPKKYQYLSTLALVIVGENQIVSDITNEMKHIVYEPIRIMFKEHAIDETMHAKYFAIIFNIIWNQLDHKEKEILGNNICEAMIILGLPRTDIYYYSLTKLGFDENSVKLAIEEIYHTPEWKERLKNRMSPTISLLNSTGIFQISTIRNLFLEHGLI